MTTPRTGAERFFEARMEDPEYRDAYDAARRQIDQIDAVVRAFDERREELEMTKADLARRAGMKPESIRRLFSAERPNPTLATLTALALALDLDISVSVKAAPVTRAPAGASGTRRRSA